MDSVAPWTVRQFHILVGPYELKEPSTRQLAFLQASIGFRQIIHASHAAIVYANIRQS